MAFEPATDAEVNAITGPRRGVIIFRDVVVFLFGARGARSLGIYDRRRIAGTSTWSLHAVGRALDIGVTDRQLGDELCLRVIAAAGACGVMEVIWWDQRWTPGTGSDPYHGVDPHRTHLHLGFTSAIADNGSKRDDLCRWFAAALIG